MKIVILADEADSHAAPITWGLEQTGHSVASWGGLGWTENGQAAIDFAAGSGSTPEIRLGACRLEAGDVVWLRRLPLATLHPEMCEADKTFAEEEYLWFHYSLGYLLERLPITCINRYSVARVINNKSVQLLLAAKCGLRVPRTSMSNSPAALKSFLNTSPGRNVCKAFFPHAWRVPDSGALAITATFEINRETVPSDQVLTYAPAIYQEMVVKQFDVRMVLMGTAIYSFIIRNPKAALDWRQDAAQGLIRVEAIETPPEVQRAVLEFARESGVVFGSFDFTVDMQGSWWFLELNEQGQFLWLDSYNPAAGIMQRFLAFLTSPGSSPGEIEARQSRFPSMKDYLRAVPHRPVATDERTVATVMSSDR